MQPNNLPQKSNFITPQDQDHLTANKDILELISNNGKSSVDYRKASTVFMVKLFNELQQGKTITQGSGQSRVKPDISKSDTIRSFSAEAKTNSIKKSNRIVYFQIPELPNNERLRTAEIRFLRHPIKYVPGVKMRFKIELKRGDSVVKKVVLRVKTQSQGEHEVIDVSRIVRPWFNGYQGNLSIHIKVPKKLKLTKHRGSVNFGVLIVFYLEDEQFLSSVYKNQKQEKRDKELGLNIVPSRKKRHKIGRGGRRRNRGECKLYNFEVDFNVIGWGQWVIHPQKFNARFCFGECASPIDVKYKPTNHAMLKALMRAKGTNSAPAACCVPTKLRPLTMLYYEYDEIVVRHHEEMIASECGCR
ncbi:bone morphogenetic protein 4-like [Patella vulgata]|uniref:bone morphogenetic protein 4-like n=1 Tax=Patella vulgata TaxID=6465 RepID=UPI00217F974D|nr:bone morphogenetic protein 4-like [Patella vulgata]